MNKHIYQLSLTEKQARALSFVCDQYSRLIEGQDFAYQELFEGAWEHRCLEATGERMSDDWDGGWQNMRQDAENMANLIKARFWALRPNELHGIGYDDYADMLFDIHRVIRHQLWLDNPKRSMMTVDADNPRDIQFGRETLAEIRRIEG